MCQILTLLLPGITFLHDATFEIVFCNTFFGQVRQNFQNDYTYNNILIFQIHNFKAVAVARWVVLWFVEQEAPCSTPSNSQQCQEGHATSVAPIPHYRHYMSTNLSDT